MFGHQFAKLLPSDSINSARGSWILIVKHHLKDNHTFPWQRQLQITSAPAKSRKSGLIELPEEEDYDDLFDLDEIEPEASDDEAGG